MGHCCVVQTCVTGDVLLEKLELKENALVCVFNVMIIGDCDGENYNCSISMVTVQCSAAVSTY